MLFKRYHVLDPRGCGSIRGYGVAQRLHRFYASQLDDIDHVYTEAEISERPRLAALLELLDALPLAQPAHIREREIQAWRPLRLMAMELCPCSTMVVAQRTWPSC